jgi:hypothetical protein
MRAWRRGHLQPLSEDSSGAQSTRQHGLKTCEFIVNKNKLFLVSAVFTLQRGPQDKAGF